MRFIPQCMHELATVLLWVVVGAKVMFAAVIAPTVFQTLEPEPAGRLLRSIFPRLYLLCAILAGVSGIGFILEALYGAAGLILAMAGVYLLSRGPLTTWINAARDAELEGEPGAKARFDRLHTLSVRIFSLQLLVLIGTAVYW